MHAPAQVPSDLAQAVQQHVQHANPDATVVRAVAGRVVHAGDIQLLLPPPDPDSDRPAAAGGDFWGARMVERRRRLLPDWDDADPPRLGAGWARPVGVGLAGTGPVQTVLCDSVPQDVVLVRSRLIGSLRELLQPPLKDLGAYAARLSGGGDGALVLHLSATLRVAKSDSDEDHAAAAPCAIKALRGSVTVTPLPQGGRAGAGGGGGEARRVVASGVGLDPSRVVAALLATQRPPPECPAALTAGDVTGEERRRIRRERLHEALPEGFFFDGSNYVDFDGREHAEHPHMDLFVRDWLQQRNAGAAHPARAAPSHRARRCGSGETEGGLSLDGSPR